MKTLKKPKVAKPKILLRPRREEQEDQSKGFEVKECYKEDREDYSIDSSEGSVLESSLCAYVSALGERCKNYSNRRFEKISYRLPNTKWFKQGDYR